MPEMLKRSLSVHNVPSILLRDKFLPQMRGSYTLSFLNKKKPAGFPGFLSVACVQVHTLNIRTYCIYIHADISVCPIQASTQHSHLATVSCCHQQGSYPEASRIFLWNKMSSFHGSPLADTEYSLRNETEHPINNPTLYLKQQEKTTTITKWDCIIDRILSAAKRIYHLQRHESVFSSFSPTPSQRREKINKQPMGLKICLLPFPSLCKSH